MHERRKRLPKSPSLDTKLIKFCPTCGDQHSKKVEGLCASCKQGAEEILKNNICVVYCRKCKKFRAPDQKKDGLLVRNLVTGAISVLVYDDSFVGCHDCRDNFAQDRPHNVLTRLMTKPNDVA